MAKGAGGTLRNLPLLPAYYILRHGPTAIFRKMNRVDRVDIVHLCPVDKVDKTHILLLNTIP